MSIETSSAAPSSVPGVELVITRVFAAPRELVWRAWTGAEHLSRWFAPRGATVEVVMADARPGGALHFCHHLGNGEDVWVKGVYREVDGGSVLDFSRIDAALGRLLETGLRPIIELSFTPADLASDPKRTVFDYRGIISPPRDLGRWRDLVEALVRHLVDRHGRDEVARWLFEVWNEPNLQVFWTGTEGDYFDLYDASAEAVKAVDPAFDVGGPSTSAVGWVDDLLDHARKQIVPIDFVSTHTYGAPPLDLRPILARAGRPDLPIWWTEWGVSPRHGAPVNDSVWGAPLVARGMRSAAGRLHSLAYWVASDQFVELGAPERLFHGGFGLLTVGNLRKPRFWAIWILEQLGTRELACQLEGDGAGSLVEAWASRDDDRVVVAVWNGTLDQGKAVLSFEPRHEEFTRVRDTSSIHSPDGSA